MIKLGLDYHGVITDNPKLFSNLSLLILHNNGEIHVITGERITPEIYKHLDKLQIYFTHIFSILDYHIQNKTTRAWQDSRGWWIKREVWNKTKAWYCLKNKIDLHIDDSEIYGKYFKTPYLLYSRTGASPLNIW